MNFLPRYFFKGISVAASALAAAAIGGSLCLAINLVPALIWGEEILIVSPFITGLPSMLAGLFVFAWLFKNLLGWLEYGLQPPRAFPAMPQTIFMGVTLACAAAVWFVAQNGLYAQFFDVAFREEVRLGGGGLTVVETRRTYERTGWRLREFKDARLHSTELGFDPAPGQPRVTFSTPLQPVYLNQFDGLWYLVLAQTSNSVGPASTTDGWGQDVNTKGQRLAILNGRKFEPAGWEKAPTNIVLGNLLTDDMFGLPMAMAAKKEIVKLEEKQDLRYRAIHAGQGGERLRITRSKAMNLPMNAEYRQAVADLEKPP